MIAQYTKLFSEWIKEHNTQWVEFSTLVNLFIPKFEADMIDNDGIDLTTMIELKYKNREIGQETDDLFYDSLKYAFNKVILKYSNKVILYKENFRKLLERKVSLDDDGEELNYLQPISNASEKLDSKFSYKSKKEQAFGYFQSNPDIMQKALEIKDLYNEMVNEFEFCFLGVY